MITIALLMMVAVASIAGSPRCNEVADVGFILDSSGSLAASYGTEKKFLKSLAAAFGISKDGARASVVTFSLTAKLSIKFKDHFDIASFNKAVDGIPLMGSLTRIDLALRVAQRDMFKAANGARVNTPKVLILLTDGSQTNMRGAENPAVVSKELRQSGIHLIVVGIGSGINHAELTRIAGRSDKVFSAGSFEELISKKFTNNLMEKSCKEVATTSWRLQEQNVCFGARDNQFGSFHLKGEGMLTALMLVHKSGYVSCVGGANHQSHWGCRQANDIDLGVYITDKRNRKIFPKYSIPPTPNNWLRDAWYFLPGYDSMSPKLAFTDISTPMYAFKGQEVRIWYGEDLIDKYEGDNSGKSCVDVYAEFS